MALFRKPEAGQDAHWLPVKDLRSVVFTPTIDVADTELLAIAHQFPLLVAVRDLRVSVVAFINENFVLKPALDPRTGRYNRTYVPLFIRALPFRLNPLDGTVEVLSSSIVSKGLNSRPIFAADGGLHADVEQISAVLHRYRQGCIRLTEAAHSLFAANLLVEMPALGEGDERQRFYTIDDEAYSALQPFQLVGLAATDYISLDLAASISFSRRLFRPSYQSIIRPNVDLKAHPLTPENIDQLVRDIGTIELELDQGELVDTEYMQPTKAKET